ncbi:hypothetical protein [Faecalimicrobium sp. JNUCC 81]
MNKDKNSLICLIIVIIFSIINIFSMYLSKFIITRTVEYNDLTLMYPPLEMTSRALNFTYLGLVGFTVYYFLVYRKNDNK